MEIRLLTFDDLDHAGDHLVHHFEENGTEGDPYFMPYGPESPLIKEEWIEKRRPRWAASPGSGVPWERMWGLFDGEHLAGHVDLHQGPLVPQSHRVLLGVGLRRPYRGQGHGRRLVQHAIDEARAMAGVDWLDLGVFANNPKAVRLYTSLGFKETGRINDLFRIGGISIDDIQMTLWVGGGDAP